MSCEIIAEVRRLTLKRLINLTKNIFQKYRTLPIDLSLRGIVEAACRVGYRDDEWRGYLHLFVDLANFNNISEILKSRNVYLIYTKYGQYLDCISYRDHDGTEMAVICEDPDLNGKLKRVTFLDLDRIEKYIDIRFRIICRRGTRTTNYIFELPEISTDVNVPVYYIMRLTGIDLRTLAWSVIAALILGKDIITDSTLALGILLSTRDVIEVEHARFFMTDSEIDRIVEYTPDIIVQEKDKVVTLSRDGKIIMRLIRIGSSILKMVYIDFIGLLMIGIELRPVRLFIY
ncbi:MAG: hypothetical protein GXO23_02135 [Crenarchaeota archaeon]|nr:hypothetical protein [Thermoproteota archaeon]